MYRWKKRMLYKRMGILLTVAGYLFFFFFLTDLRSLMVHVQLPLVTYMQEDEKTAKSYLFEMGMQVALPLPVYAGEVGSREVRTEDDETLQALMELQEAEKPDSTGEDEDILRQMEKENQDAKESVSRNQVEDADAQTIHEEAQEDDASRQTAQTPAEQTDEQTGEEQVQDGDFVPAQGPVYDLHPEEYRDFDALLKKFYVIDTNTYIDGSELNVDKLLNTDLTIEKADVQTDATEDYSQTKNPQILIYHTHSQEGYADSVAGDEDSGVMGAGEELARLLSQEYGFRVLHHKGKYDVKSRDYAYSEAVPGLEQVLAENPSIEVIIDLHRDGVGDETHLVTDLNGKRTAQVMLFNGLSRTKKIGEIAYLKNENRESNLAFSFQLQTKMMEYYPGLARKIYLKGYRYNMHYRPRSLLIELGAQTNTEEEVRNALPPLAHCIAMVLEGT